MLADDFVIDLAIILRAQRILDYSNVQVLSLPDFSFGLLDDFGTIVTNYLTFQFNYLASNNLI
jgi:hypothetical protein